MKNKITEMGIAYKLIAFSFPYLVLTIILTLINPDYYQLNDFMPNIFRVSVGIALILCGIGILAICGMKILYAFKNDEFITKGIFGFSRNPMYGSYVLFIIPGLALLLNSWIILTSSIVMYISIRILIRPEEDYLQTKFGENFSNYKQNVGFIVPKYYKKDGPVIKLTKILLWIFIIISFLLSLSILFMLNPPASVLQTFPKIISVSLAPYIALICGICIISGIFILIMYISSIKIVPFKKLRKRIVSMSILIMIALFSIIVFANYVTNVNHKPDILHSIFSDNWESQISKEDKQSLLKNKFYWEIPAYKEPMITENVVYNIDEINGRKLHTDIFKSSDSKSSGVALVYLYSGNWQTIDKNYPRPFLKYIASQGHTVFGVETRSRKETSLFGIISDVKHIINWIKINSNLYNVNPNNIVLCGGSSGGHIALLSAYSEDIAMLSHPDLFGKDLSVKGVISFYGVSDLEKFLNFFTSSIENKTTFFDNLGNILYKTMFKTDNTVAEDTEEAMQTLLGGLPDTKPERYSLGSPISYVNSSVPYTLLIHGSHDEMSPVSQSKILYKKLRNSNAKAGFYEIPQTNHIFDYILPNITPAYHSSLFYVERFLLLISKH